MREITVSSATTLYYAEGLFKLLGYKCGAFIPFFRNEEREMIRVYGRTMTKKDYKLMENIDLETARSYCETKDCDYFFTVDDREEENPFKGKVKRKKGIQTFSIAPYGEVICTNLSKDAPGCLLKAIELVGPLKVTYKLINYIMCADKGEFGLNSVSLDPLFLETFVRNRTQAINLRESLKEICPKKAVVMILGFDESTPYNEFLSILTKDVFHVLTVKLPNHTNALGAHEIAEAVMAENGAVTEVSSIEEAIEIAKLLAGNKGAIVRVN